MDAEKKSSEQMHEKHQNIKPKTKKKTAFEIQIKLLIDMYRELKCLKKFIEIMKMSEIISHVFIVER